MDMNRLTQRSQEAVQQAQSVALRYGHTEVDGEHLLPALLEAPEGLVPRLLAQFHVGVDALRTAVATDLQRRPKVTRRVMRLEIEDAALAKETDPASQARLDQLRRELADLRAEADSMRAQWEAERQAIRRVQELRAELERVRREVEQAERAYDLNRAAELRYSTLADLQRRLAAEEAALTVKQGAHRLLREVITEDEIAEIVSAWTQIPISRLTEGERDKLLRLDEILHERVIGQDEAARLLVGSRPGAAEDPAGRKTGPWSPCGSPMAP